MAINVPDPKRVIEYIPSYADNRDSEDPCVVKLKYVPYGKVQEYARRFAARTEGITEPEKINEISQEIQREQFLENVESISGFFIQDSSGLRDITDAGEFYDGASQALVLEIAQVMENPIQLLEGERGG